MWCSDIGYWLCRRKLWYQRDLIWQHRRCHPSSMWIMESYTQHVHPRFCGILTSLREFLTGWACGKILLRQWVWSARSAISTILLAGTPTQRMVNGWRVREKIPRLPVTTHPVPVLRGGHGFRVTGDTPTDAEWCQIWTPLVTPTPPRNRPQKLLRIFIKGVKFIGVTGGGVTRKDSNMYKSMGEICASTPAGNRGDHGGVNPPQYVLILLWNGFSLGFPQRMSHWHWNRCQGGERK